MGFSPLLYYPLISIRTGRWLRQSLLYWDQIGSIVPQSYDDEALVPYTPDIEYLKSEGEYKPFRPDALLSQEYGAVREFENELLEIIASSNFHRMSPLLYSRKMDAKIHHDKVSGQVFDFLEQEGLAIRRPDDYDWYYFERNTGLLYMSLLAKYLAGGDRNLTVPSTNFRAYEKLNFQARPGADASVCLKARFRDILPVPRHDIPLSDILEFKRNRRDQLLAFRQQVSAIETALSHCKSEAEVTEALADAKEQIEKGLIDLESTLADSKLATVPGSFEALIKTALPATIPEALVWAGKATNIANIPIGWAIAGSAVAGTVGIGKYFVDKRNERRITGRNSPFSYLHAAKSELGFGYTRRV